jgi:hypothetical protein
VEQDDPAAELAALALDFPEEVAGEPGRLGGAQIDRDVVRGLEPHPRAVDVVVVRAARAHAQPRRAARTALYASSRP